MSGVFTVGDVCNWMDSKFPPALAEEWDRVGLICGDRRATVEKILLAIDPVEEVVSEALDWGAQMIITHHPLYLRGTSFVSTDTAKGRVVHELIRGGCALFNAHTNADSAPGGVAESLAAKAGLTPDKCRVLVETPNYVGCGIGRIGELDQPISVEELAERIAVALPASPGGILVGGDLDKVVKTVAVSGGSGDSLLRAVTEAGADAFITADIRHHPGSEHLEDGGPALIVPTHWASEWVWLPNLAIELELFFAKESIPITVKVSEKITEPWSAYISSVSEGEEL